jgi:hypothetical protein
VPDRCSDPGHPEKLLGRDDEPLMKAVGDPRLIGRPREVAHESFLVYRRFRHLKLALLLILASLIPYLAWQPVAGHNGGTWLGYTLGTIAALLIVWLMLFGIRKRRYGPGHWSLKAWLSAHVYLGLSLVVVASLHAGFQVGLNIHTLAYVLMLAVIISGVVGIVSYARVPRLMTSNRAGQTLEGMAREMLDLDRQCGDLALELGDEFVEEVRRAREETRLGGSIWRQLSARDPKCGTARALADVHALAGDVPAAMRERATALLVTLQRKQQLLQRARRDIRLKALLELWLACHVPLSFALLAALIAHITAVFFYWG